METNDTYIPRLLMDIENRTTEIGFNMASGRSLGTLLRTLATSMRTARLLELGTGTGLSLAWMVDGMDAGSSMISIDNDQELCAIARGFFETDQRVQLLCTDAGSWISSYKGEKFDLVFADAWPGKYSHLQELLTLIKPGGIYVVDDLLEQPNWPPGHATNVSRFLSYMEARTDFHCCFLNCSSGILLATKKW